jgi:hypothetical protein
LRPAGAADATSRIRVDPTSVARLLPDLAAADAPTRRDLLLQTLLHLPRLAAGDGTIAFGPACIEITRQRNLRAAELAPLAELAKSPTRPPALDQLEVRAIDAAQAAPILAHLHYLRSFRQDSVNIAAVYRQRVVALCSVSPLDLAAVAAELPIDSPEQGAVISRVFAFDWAPRNTVSYMLARAELSPALADARVLVTYLNPNLGFTGASYKAANWRPLGFEIGTRYAYLNGRYITDRQLLTLPADERGSVEHSRMPLRPLLLYGRYRDRRLAHVQRGTFAVSREIS